MATLYELSAGYASLLDMYDQAETEDERAEILDMLAGAEGDIAQKAEAYARIMRNKQAEADAFKAEADRLTQKRRAAEAVVERMKGALLDAMKMVGASEISTTIGKWRTQMNPWSVEITAPEYVPARFMVPQPDKVDKKAILDEFRRTGELIDGVEFRQELGIRFR